MGEKEGYYKVYFEDEFKGFGKVTNGISTVFFDKAVMAIRIKTEND